jgi:hypothetical protein
MTYLKTLQKHLARVETCSSAASVTDRGTGTAAVAECFAQRVPQPLQG